MTRTHCETVWCYGLLKAKHLNPILRMRAAEGMALEGTLRLLHCETKKAALLGRWTKDSFRPWGEGYCPIDLAAWDRCRKLGLELVTGEIRPWFEWMDEFEGEEWTKICVHDMYVYVRR